MLNLTQNAALIQETLVADTVAPGTVAQRAIAPTPASPSKIVVDLSDRSLTLYREGYPDQQFPIAVGRVGWETPKGEFEVINKQMHPIWQNPLTQEIVPSGPNNPLGTRWIGFWTDGRNELGFHGTNETDLIGQAVSHGCIRMENRHIQELYPHVDVGTPVSIQP
jgi:lipoprotein-anchoring transpeptidase ErfK/SrfK